MTPRKLALTIEALTDKRIEDLRRAKSMVLYAYIPNEHQDNAFDLAITQIQVMAVQPPKVAKKAKKR